MGDFTNLSRLSVLLLQIWTIFRPPHVTHVLMSCPSPLQCVGTQGAVQSGVGPAEVENKPYLLFKSR